MSEVSDMDIGRLMEKVDQLSVEVRENNARLDRLEHQLERTRGIGIGIVLATIGVSGAGASLLTKWISSA